LSRGSREIDDAAGGPERPPIRDAHIDHGAGVAPSHPYDRAESQGSMGGRECPRVVAITARRLVPRETASIVAGFAMLHGERAPPTIERPKSLLVTTDRR